MTPNSVAARYCQWKRILPFLLPIPKSGPWHFQNVISIEATQEIVQEIFSSIWERRDSLFIEAVPNYLAIAVKHRAINFIKSQLAFRKYSNLYKAICQVNKEETMEAASIVQWPCAWRTRAYHIVSLWTDLSKSCQQNFKYIIFVSLKAYT